MASRRTGPRFGMTRMDAAIDAMIPLGFPTQIVQDKMNDLLKGEASGDERVGNHTVVTTATAGLSSGSNDTPNMLLPTGRAEGDTNRQRDTVLKLAPSEEEGMDEVSDQSDGSVEDLYCPSVFSFPSSFASTPAEQSNPTQRRRPCYGWISDGDEDDNDLFYLTPATQSPTVQMDDLSNEAVRSSKRRSRWDM